VKNIERWIKQLKQENKIEFRGAPKTGGYYIKNNQEGY
jgi:ATP-dependent DNA helicase RecG